MFFVSQTLNCNENRFYGSNELDINIRINLSFYDFKSPSMSDSDLLRGFPDNQQCRKMQCILEINKMKERRLKLHKMGKAVREGVLFSNLSTVCCLL